MILSNRLFLIKNVTAGDKYLNISVIARLRDHSDKIKVVRNCLFHIMKLFYEHQSEKIIAHANEREKSKTP